MKSFRHVDVTTVTEAVAALEYYKGKAVLNAGATDLLGILKDSLLPEQPAALINIKTIAGLNYIRADSAGVRIGALTRLSEIAASPAVSARHEGLARAARSVATPEIRNMGTLGGNLCQQVRCWYYRYPHHLGGRIICYRKGQGTCPAIIGDNRYHAIMGGKVCFAVCPSDLAVMLAALDARITLYGPEGERTLGIQDFFHTLGNVMGPREILTEVQVPLPPDNSRQTFHKYRLREQVDFAIVSIGSVIGVTDGRCTHAKIALGAVAPTPVRATGAENLILGKSIDADLAEAAARAAVTGAKPLGKNAYKIEITKTLVRRMLLSQL
ncbi:MAG: FAD binding domain-containing protein [Desulfobacterales bacterium]|nr:FAD binding domain-containing protein [Desulfobacterales bacterium]